MHSAIVPVLREAAKGRMGKRWAGLVERSGKMMCSAYEIGGVEVACIMSPEVNSSTSFSYQWPMPVGKPTALMGRLCEKRMRRFDMPMRFFNFET